MKGKEMLNLIKILLAVSLASFSVNASAYAYIEKGSNGVHRAGDSFKGSKEVTKKKLKKQWKTQWSNKSYKCGWLCKGDNKHKPKISVSSVDKKRLLVKFKNAYTGMVIKRGLPTYKHTYKIQAKPPVGGHSVPEPGIVGLLAIGLLGMVVRRRFKV